MEKKNVGILTAAIAVLILVAANIYYFSKPQKDQFLESKKDAEREYNSGNLVKAAELVQETISKAPNKLAEAEAKLLLGFVYLPWHYEKATAVFKEVAGNAEYPAEVRAQALTNMADYYMIGERKSGELADAIFSGEPYLQYRLEEDGNENILLGIRRLYEFSGELYSLPFAEYRIAEWYAKQAVRSVIYQEKLPKSASFYIENADKFLIKGNEAMATSRVKGAAERGYSEWLKGEVLGLLSRAKKDDSLKNQAEEAFKSALSDLEEAPGTVYENSQEMWAKFAYASFLANNFEKSRNTDIVTMTSFISDIKNRHRRNGGKVETGLVRYLRRIGRLKNIGAQTKLDYDDAAALSKIDPKFKVFLNELGWGLK